jgi:DivIVA domain-containing protein
MSTHEDMPRPMRGVGPMSPAGIREVRFTRAPIARRGYDIDEVNRFLYRLAEQVAARDAEKAALRAEVERLRDWIRTRIQDSDDAGAPAAAGLNAQMIALMSQAQQQADAYIAQAEAYSRRLTIEARQRADELLTEAEAAVHQGHQAMALPGGADTAEVAARLAEVQRRTDWLRAFCRATQMQLQAASEAFFQEVDRVAHLPEPLHMPPHGRPMPPDEIAGWGANGADTGVSGGSPGGGWGN